MDEIFDIRFSYEAYIRDNVVIKYATKQGGIYGAFAYYWQCFAWAAFIGFVRDIRKPLSSKLADKSFSLKTMKENGGDTVVQALICAVIAKEGTVEILKRPSDFISIINEYANGGFYYIHELEEKGETASNALETIKQEIFSREMPKVKA